MIRWLSTLALSALFVSSAFAVEDCGPLAKSTAFTSIEELTKKSCQEVKDSKQCQDTYKEIQNQGKDPLKFSLVCESKRAYIPQSLNWAATGTDYITGCAIGGWDHVEKLGTMIGESAAQFVLDREKKDEELAICDKDGKKKKTLYDNYNSQVPALLKIEVPSETTLAQQDCAKIESDLVIKQRQQSQRAFKKVRGRLNDRTATYTPEEQEFIDWTNKINRPSSEGNVIDLAKKHLKEMGIKLECYNSTRSAAIVCEAIADVMTVPSAAGMGLKVVRAARIAKLAGMEKKVGEFVQEVNAAKRATASNSARITDANDKASVLYRSGNLTNEERIMAFEKLSGKTLTPRESDQLIKMHDVGTKEGRGYTTYTKEDIADKQKLASEINPDTGKPYFSADDTKLLLRNGITGGTGNVQKATARETYAAKAAKEDYSQYHRLHAEAAAGEGKIEEAATAYKKAYTSYTREKKVDLKDTASTQSSLKNLSESELAQLEDLAASSGNTQQLTEISKAKWAATETKIRKDYQGRPGQADAISDKVHSEYTELTQLSYSQNTLTKKAAEEKLKALKATYPGLR